MTPLAYALPGNEAFAQALARAWPAELAPLEAHHFPDGETRLRLLGAPRGREVALVCTLREPDASVLPLLFAAGTARELGARSVGLVAPYLAYLRQDRAFREGESVSARHFARLLSAHFDWLTCVDPHLHRLRALGEIYSIPTVAVPAAPGIARWIARHVERPLLVGPDEESRQWVAQIAEAAQAPWLIFEKRRAGDADVAIRVPDMGRWRAHTPVIVDDIVSSGATAIALARQLRAQGLAPPVCIAVHGVFAAHAYRDLLEAGVARVVSTNTIEHPSNAIDVVADVAQACRRLMPATGAPPRLATR